MAESGYGDLAVPLGGGVPVENPRGHKGADFNPGWRELPQPRPKLTRREVRSQIHAKHVAIVKKKQEWQQRPDGPLG